MLPGQLPKSRLWTQSVECKVQFTLCYHDTTQSRVLCHGNGEELGSFTLCYQDSSLKVNFGNYRLPIVTMTPFKAESCVMVMVRNLVALLYVTRTAAKVDFGLKV